MQETKSPRQSLESGALRLLEIVPIAPGLPAPVTPAVALPETGARFWLAVAAGAVLLFACGVYLLRRWNRC